MSEKKSRRNEDTSALNQMYRQLEQSRLSRSHDIRDRERRARERARKELEQAMYPDREYRI